IFWRYVYERLIICIATVVISVTIVFFAPRLVPGDPGAVTLKLSQMGGNRGSPELVAEYSRRFGLDKSPVEQYVAYLRQLAQGDMGYSIASFPSTVGDLLKGAIPWTIGLMLVTTVISWSLGSIIGGVVGWTGGRSPLLQALVPIALVLYTIPYYILAIVLVFLLAFYWPIFPLTGAYTIGAQPSLTPGFIFDIIHHAALLALATGLALSLGHIVGGQLVTETIFGYPGLGYLIFNSIKTLDFPVIQGSILLIIVSVAIVNFVLDLIYPLIDPRIRYGAVARS